MLQELCEKGSVSSDLSLYEEVSERGFVAYGYQGSSSIEDIGDSMGESFKKLDQNKDLPKAEFAISLYTEKNLYKNKFKFLCAYAYPKALEKTPKGMKRMDIPEHKAISVTLVGPYKYLANAWSTVENARRFLKKSENRRIPAYEIYSNSPLDTAEKDLETIVRVPVKY